MLPPVRSPRVQTPYRVVPAPRPLAGPVTISLDDGWPAAVRRRLERLTSDRDGVVVAAHIRAPAVGVPLALAPGLRAALRVAWSLLPGIGHLGLDVDVTAGTCRRIGPSAYEPATAYLLGLDGLDLLIDGWLLACSDDLVVLRRTGAGELITELLAVAFPSGWSPRERAGVGLTALHAPVADADRLQRAAPALSEALLTKGPLTQHVWGFDPEPRLDHDPSAPDASTRTPPMSPDRWWLRVERQTSVPLPELDRALFLIRPYLRPLTALDGGERRELAEAVAGMSPAARAYKGIEAVADELVAWLRG